jgi:hypothetical protein
MDPEWIEKTILQMQESMDVAVQDTAEILLRNEDKLVFKANVLDPNGINRWGEDTRIVQELNLSGIQPGAPQRLGK